jgi:hypothetical protein
MRSGIGTGRYTLCRRARLISRCRFGSRRSQQRRNPTGERKDKQSEVTSSNFTAPIATFGALGNFKAEIDERDVDKVSIGQEVVIQADALEGKRLNGSVARISAMMGRKSISTGDPSDKSDRDILEAVIGLEDNSRSLPIGLRVTVQFLTTTSLKK